MKIEIKLTIKIEPSKKKSPEPRKSKTQSISQTTVIINDK